MIVVFAWDVRPELRAYLEAGLAGVPGVRLVFPGQLSPTGLVFPGDAPSATLIELAADADIIVGWRPTADLLAAAPRLRLWVNPGAGVQNIVGVIRAANAGRAAPITLVNGHGNAYFTAQHAVALLLALTNKIVPHHNWMAAGQWRKGDAAAASIPLKGRTVGLLGYGHINRNVHRFLSGFGVGFAILKRSWDEGGDVGGRDGGGEGTSDREGGQGSIFATAARFTPDWLGEFLDGVDTLIIAIPQTPETTGWIDAAALRRLGPGGLLVNVGRAPIVVEADLFAALRDRTLAGAALDVWYDYAPEPDAEDRRFPYTWPFHALDNVVLSPHRAASPLDDLRRWDEVIANIGRTAAGRTDWANVVDLERGY